jgi:sugar phosphate isomerase/epimerase
MPRFQYCLNSSTIQPVPLLDKIRLASDAGFRALELWSDDIDACLQAGGALADIRRALEDRGLEVPGVIAVHGWLGSRGKEHAAALTEAGRRMEQAAAIGSRRIVASPPLERCDLDGAAEQYRELIELGSGFGVWPAMEFLGFAGSVHTITQAWEIARGADHPEARVVMDPFHILRGGGSVAEIAQVPGDRVAIWHWNDVPPAPPLPQQGDADRVMPGDGAGPLREIERQAVASGYAGYVSLELFNREWWERDPAETVRIGMEKMRRFFGDAG